MVLAGVIQNLAPHHRGLEITMSIHTYLTGHVLCEVTLNTSPLEALVIVDVPIGGGLIEKIFGNNSNASSHSCSQTLLCLFIVFRIKMLMVNMFDTFSIFRKMNTNPNSSHTCTFSL